MMAQDHPSSNPVASRKKFFWVGIVVVIVLSLLVLLGLKLFSESGSAVSIGQSPPDFALETYGGETIHTNSLRGKVVLINFWSSWCTTCDEEAKMLEEAWSTFAREQPGRVAFLGVAYMDTLPDSLSFIETYGVTYPNGPDLRGEISNLYQVSSVPETYILGTDGVLRAVKIGPFTSTEEIYQAIAEAASGD